MARVLILGGGFAAISAAETLASVVGGEQEIILVSNTPNFVFYPGIIPAVFGDFQLEEIRSDLRPQLAAHGIQFFQADVRAINTKSRTVQVAGDRMDATIGFDFLIVAVGRRLAAANVPGLAEYSHSILTVDGAIEFKKAIADFETGSIVIGLCSEASLPVPVCETALALAARFEKQIRHGDVSVNVVVPTTLENAFAGTALFRDVVQEFDRKGIRLVSDFPVSEVEESRIRSSLGASLKYDLLMLIPAFGGQLSLHNLGPVTDTSGFARVNSLMQVQGLESVYAAGEIVSMPGPKFGYLAMRQGKVAAQNILAQLKGETPTVEYIHRPAWAIAEKYTDPIFFHYGFWDDTLDDFDENALFGMARKLRDHYGPVDISKSDANRASN